MPVRLDTVNRAAAIVDRIDNRRVFGSLLVWFVVDCTKGGTGMSFASPRVRLALLALASLLAAALMGGAGWGP